MTPITNYCLISDQVTAIESKDQPELKKNSKMQNEAIMPEKSNNYLLFQCAITRCKLFIGFSSYQNDARRCYLTN